jgi:hypothetical protein
MMRKIRRFLSNTIIIHLMVFLGLAALWGYIELKNQYLLLCVVLSFSGAICGGFVRVIDTIKNQKK